MERTSKLSKRDYVEQDRFEGRGWPLRSIVRIPAHNAVRRPGAPRAAVVPIRQFCEVKRPGAGTHAASFTRLGEVSFDTPPDDKLAESITYTSARGTATTRRFLSMTFDFVPSRQHGDLDDKIRDICLQEALDDEAAVLLGCVYDDDRPEGQGGGIKKNWINGNTGSDLDGDSLVAGNGEASLTCRGLSAAKKKIRDHGFGADRTVCYTTATALTDLKHDQDFARKGGPALGDGAASAGDTAIIDGILLVATPLLAAPARGTRDAGARSVMFVPDFSFGVISDNAVTIRCAPHGENGCRLEAHHLVGGAVIAAGSTCRISHA